MMKKKFCLLLVAGGIYASASTFDWSATNWSDGQLSGSYTDVNGSGIDITVNITGNTDNFKSGYPALSDDNGNLANEHLLEFVDFDDNTQSVTTTIKFSIPVKLSSLIWRDIDAMNDGTYLFDDKVIVSAVDTDGNTVYPDVKSLGSNIQDDGNGVYEAKDNNHNYSPEDTEATLTLGFSNTYVKQISYTYTSGDGIGSGDDPTQQAQFFDNFNFIPKDTDGDGRADSIDIDDDNDGILNRDEELKITSTNTETGTIPDDGYPNDCLDRTFNIAQSGNVLDVTIYVDINHTWRGDLVVDLISPSGTKVDLTSDNGGSYDNLKVLFDDNASSSITDYDQDMNPPPQIVLRPEESLAAFNGEDSEGTWTLHMCDDAGGDEGTFNSATLNIVDERDTDGDGIVDRLDLDSDNDGIPDNIEAQSTKDYVAPSGTDADNDGLDDVYDQNTSGVPGSIGLIPPDRDKDGIPDFLDNDTDNDGYGDCEEGQDPNQVNRSCSSDGKTVVGTIQSNGLVDWAGSDGYDDVNGNVNQPDPDASGGGDLEDEVSGNDEAAYREFLCGKGRIYLTKYHWRLISLPCNTGNNSVQDVFSQLGTYGNDADFVVYAQTGADNYEVNDTHPNTQKRMLQANDTLQQGISYWIITDADHNVTIPKTLSGLSPTTTQDASSISISNRYFDKVAQYQLPSNSSDNVKKYMAGNPFPYSFNMGNLYFRHDDSASATFKPMGDSANDDYINATVYKHDSSETGPVTGYEAVAPSTPGFNAPIQSMEGFFIKLEKNSDTSSSNSFAYPLTYGNDH